MKKLLATLVLLSATVAAQAQITLYGALDGSVNAIKNAGTAGSTAAYVDSAMATSRLGFRGSEDIGGGTRAIFQLESDVLTNSGGTHQSGIFRRAAYVGLANNLGELTLGTRMNPLIATHATLMPLAGNSVDATIASAFGYADFYTKNAVTYTTPTINGLRAQIQYGMSNTAGLDSQGSVVAGNVRYDVGRLTLMAAGQDRQRGGTTSSSNSTSTTAQGDATTYMAGAQYKVTPTLTAATAYVKNDLAGLEKTNMQFGVRYDVTTNTSIGVNHMRSATEDNNLTNVQARYALSKRTTVYTQVAVADNNSKSPVRTLNTTTGTSPAANVSGFIGVPNEVQRSVGIGLIHTF